MELVKVVEGVVTTTSKDVADMFSKEHKHVLESIKKLVNNLEFNQPNFRPVEYKDLKGENRPMYLIDRDGFTLLAMGFNGNEALKFKIAYIQAFNKMESELMKRNSIQTPSNLLEAMEFATNQLRITIEQQKVIDEQKVLIIEKDNKIEEDKPKVFVYDEVIDSSKVYDMATTAKILQIEQARGRTDLFVFLRSEKILDKNNIPYQKYVTSGYFESKISNKNRKSQSTTFVTMKGIDWLCKKFKFEKRMVFNNTKSLF